MTQRRVKAGVAFQIRRHRTRDDCWLAAHGKVYRIPPQFMLIHPGSDQSILRHAGTECSEDFDFHGRDAQALWEKYLIGKVVACDPSARSSCVSS